MRDPNTIIILAPGTTDSVNTAPFKVKPGQEVTLMLYPMANLGADTGVLKKKAPDDTWVSCTDDNGIITLSSTRTMEVIVGLGDYSVEIATRTLSWGVAISRE